MKGASGGKERNRREIKKERGEYRKKGGIKNERGINKERGDAHREGS